MNKSVYKQVNMPYLQKLIRTDIADVNIRS